MYHRIQLFRYAITFIILSVLWSISNYFLPSSPLSPHPGIQSPILNLSNHLHFFFIHKPGMVTIIVENDIKFREVKF